MCNHYSKGQKKYDREEIVEWSQTRIPGTMPLPLPEFKDHIYPKYQAPVIIQEGDKRSLVAARWGILRFIGQGKMKEVTNARNDKLLGNTWKKLAAGQRCLIPANAYFEPGLGPVGAKGEIRFTVKERPFFFIAGLWDIDPVPADAEPSPQVLSFTMVTTEPNELVRTFHDRMPVVLNDDQAEAWLTNPDILSMCGGLPSEALALETLPPRLKVTRPKPAEESKSQEPELLL